MLRIHILNFRYKLHVAEEKEIHYKNEIQSLEAEFNSKITKRKVNSNICL